MPPEEPIRDLIEMPQQLLAYVPEGYADEPIIPPSEQRQLAESLRRELLGPWREGLQPPGPAEAGELFEHYIRRPGWGENLLPRDAGWVAAMRDQAALE
ncbi:MAG: hypothetical protein J7M21_04880, partial [Planctomycetes bacterium]|nr:hypothetical protein [Planctomycetota bacterium]